MKLVRFLVTGIALLLVFSSQGVSQSSPAEAFENVIIHTADGKTIKDGRIVWRNGIITQIGSDVSIPFDAYVRDGGDSLHVYPGFIDGVAHWGSPEVEEEVKTPEEPGDPSYERAGIQPHRHPVDHLKTDDKSLSEAAKKGFTTAGLVLKGQMLPGQVDLFFMRGEETKDHLMQPGVAVFAQFEEAQGAAYPSTTMALMSQFRQLFHNAKALQEQQQYFASLSSNYPAPNKDEILEALYPVMEKKKPLFFVVDSKENIERLFWLQDELGFELVIVSGKEAYKKADELKERSIPVLASIDLPEEPKWRVTEKEGEEEKKQKLEEVTEEMRVFRERQLEAYKANIQNVKKLMDAGVKVGYASNGLEPGDIHKNLETLQNEGGLTSEQILKMFTLSTAEILGYGSQLGDLKVGRVANFSIFTKPFTEEKTEVIFSVADGDITEFEPKPSKE